MAFIMVTRMPGSFFLLLSILASLLTCGNSTRVEDEQQQPENEMTLEALRTPSPVTCSAENGECTMCWWLQLTKYEDDIYCEAFKKTLQFPGGTSNRHMQNILKVLSTTVPEQRYWQNYIKIVRAITEMTEGDRKFKYSEQVDMLMKAPVTEEMLAGVEDPEQRKNAWCVVVEKGGQGPCSEWLPQEGRPEPVTCSAKDGECTMCWWLQLTTSEEDKTCEVFKKTLPESSAWFSAMNTILKELRTTCTEQRYWQHYTKIVRAITSMDEKERRFKYDEAVSKLLRAPVTTEMLTRVEDPEQRKLDWCAAVENGGQKPCSDWIPQERPEPVTCSAPDGECTMCWWLQLTTSEDDTNCEVFKKTLPESTGWFSAMNTVLKELRTKCKEQQQWHHYTKIVRAITNMSEEERRFKYNEAVFQLLNSPVSTVALYRSENPEQLKEVWRTALVAGGQDPNLVIGRRVY